MTAVRNRILIVEDEEDVVELLRYNLCREGFAVATALRGEDGLKAAVELKPDLILLDRMMPGLNGIEVCRQLKRDPTTASILIFMVTAKCEALDIEEGLNVGADEYVIKPFNIKMLISRVRLTLNAP